ncbi:MAG: class I SAM-dependent methyltransferase [Chitinophagales bacterium]|nr:class I SAM-dependent methyltransferase [Chitinophagales bacterium]
MNTCLVCNSHKIIKHLDSKDFCVSQEDFTINKCQECGFAYTVNAPDAQNIGKYYEHADYVSHTDTKEGLFFKLYHKVRNYMLGQKLKYITKQNKISTLLDIGAGTGYFVNYANNNGVKATGFEPDATARNQAQKNFNLQLKDNLASIVAQNKFDAISMWHVLEHVHDLHDYFEHFRTLLNNNGTLAIAVPNYTSYDAKMYQKYWAAYDLPKHLWHFSPNSMKELAKQHGFVHQKSYAMPFDPFYIALLSEKNKQSNFLGKFRAFIIGIASFTEGFFDAESASSVVYIFKKSN